MVIPDERVARRVGALTLLVLGAAIAGLVFLLDRASLGASIQIHVVFHRVAGLREHAPLVVAGHPVGRIEAIVPIAHGTPGALDGDVGVSATVAIAAAKVWQVPVAAEIFVASRGPLSDKYLEVAPPKGDPGPAVHDGQELRGVDPPDLDNVLQHTWNNMTTFKLFVDTVKPELAALRTQLAELRDRLDAVAAEGDAQGSGIAALGRHVRDLVAAARHTYDTQLGGDPGVAELRAMLGEARQVTAQLRAAIDQLAPRTGALVADLARVRDRVDQAAPIARAQQTIDALRAALDKIDPVLANLDELTARIASGEGSIGRILTDPEFPEDTRDLGKIMKRHPWRIMETPPDK
ncbi:MAG TPA: MlaD family protein [Kofleriaceae bacterium]|jgi:phospholipid/cholesterol/gamma-HCH transport system substrate-binding protein|nr:MlaD family protein [Kofleriaceae bacterium]